MLPAEFCVRRLPNPARRIDPGAGPIDSRPGTIDRLFRESPKQPEQKRLALRAGGKGTRVMQYCFRTVNLPSGPDLGQPATGKAPKSALRPAEGRPEGRCGFFSDSRLASLSLSLSLALSLSLSLPSLCGRTHGSGIPKGNAGLGNQAQVRLSIRKGPATVYIYIYIYTSLYLVPRGGELGAWPPKVTAPQIQSKANSNP